MSGNDEHTELTTSQINQSEAGPEIVEVDSSPSNYASLLTKNKELLKSGSAGSTETRNTGSPVGSSKNVKLGGKNGEELEDSSQRPTNTAIQVLDRLISLNPSTKEPVNIVSPLKNLKSENLTSGTNEKDQGSPYKLDSLEQSVLEIELGKLHDLLMKQEKVGQEKMSEYESHLTKLTGQTCVLQDQLKQAEEREKALVKKVNEQNQNQVQLSIVMQEYEKLISKLTAEIEIEKKQNRDKVDGLTAEKDSALVHLSNVEAAFTDVHQKYEKCKKVIEDYKKNESKMKALISDQLESLKIKEKQLETIQVHASKQLENAHAEVERSKQMHEQEMTRLRALLRKTELKVISLQESLEQKIKENQELTTICDDLIEGKVPAN
ncbi:hypothetical protein RUM43_014121 [Polyplax serrata]|uniref:Transforming acidic coiled-coil-containing protein C-terminal domain-containing protein n=1 Tax=Polyplax serrata TaxID=468196 RepID=A0AAN8PT12_POLSC